MFFHSFDNHHRQHQHQKYISKYVDIHVPFMCMYIAKLTSQAILI